MILVYRLFLCQPGVLKRSFNTETLSYKVTQRLGLKGPLLCVTLQIAIGILISSVFIFDY